MAIGLIKGPVANVQEFLQTMPLAKELRRRFEKEMNTMNCRELTGVDLSKPENFEEYANSDIPQNVCAPAVDTAYRIAMEILNEAA